MLDRTPTTAPGWSGKIGEGKLLNMDCRFSSDLTEISWGVGANQVSSFPGAFA